jgi:hypothetical protein
MLTARALGFQDADFEHDLAWRWSPLEGRSLRWTPHGMPRLNENFKHNVFFLYGRNPKTGEIEGPMGTGSLIGVYGEPQHRLAHNYYAVTCWHVAVDHGASILRLNTKDGQHRFIELDPMEWQFISGADDLCAADVTERLKHTDEISFLPPSLMVTKDFIRMEQIEIGEDGFMLGLFSEQPGIRQNMVAARFGNISLLASDDAPIEQPNEQKRPSHIFDMRSRPGFSGSPVFIYRTPDGDLRNATLRGEDKTRKRNIRRSLDYVGRGTEIQFNDVEDDWETKSNTFLMLLGIHAGQYPERVEARKETRTRAEVDDIVRDRDKLKIPSSMAVVVPAWEVVNLLNLPIFKVQRNKRGEQRQRELDQKNTPEPEANETASPTSDANPNHLKDFTRLVDVAARKKPKD